MRKILVVIDMQNDFIDGSLGTPEAVAIVNNVRRKIESYDRNDVYATRDTHQVDYLETQEGQNLPVEHCIEGTEGWQIRSSLASLIPSGHIYNKPTFGCLELAGEIQAITGATITSKAVTNAVNAALAADRMDEQSAPVELKNEGGGDDE